MKSTRSLILSTLATFAFVVPAATQQRAMTMVDLINVPRVGDPQQSPDGSQVLYTRTDADWDANGTVTHIWRADINGTNAIKLTNGEHGENSPRWSPDGTTIAFLARRGEDEGNQIFTLNNTGGEATRLIEHPTSASSLTWSPDGAWIFFLAEDDKTEAEKAREAVNDNVFAFDENWHHRHVWRGNLASGETEKITDGEFTVRSYRLSRDGISLITQRAESPLLDDGPLSEIWVSDTEGTNPRMLTNNAVGERAAQFSPDQTQVLFLANGSLALDEYYYNDKLFVVSAGGGTPEPILPDVSYQINSATWSADGNSIYFRANLGVRQELFKVELGNREVTRLTEGDHTVGNWSYNYLLDRHILGINRRDNAGDLWTLDRDRPGSLAQVTHVYDYLAEDFRLPRQEAVQWTGEDGVMVEGLLYYPLDYREGQRYPLVVQTHGGPAASDKFSFGGSSNYVQLLSSLGYMVLKPNYRGSTGYGDDFLRDMVGNYFNQAHKDVMAGVDHLIGLGLVDGNRMAKMGWSAGGHMTNKIITYTDRFKAASSGAGAANWVSMYAQSDVRVYRTPWFGGTPWSENAPVGQYWADSPIREIWKATTPTLVLVGENDARVPMPQSVELYRGLKSNGVPTHLYVAPKQGHGWRELQQRLFKANVELDWFEKWVMDREYEWELSPVHPDAKKAIS